MTRRATSNPMKGYSLTDNQMRTIGKVTKLLIEAEAYLVAEEVDNTMECYGDFVALYKQITHAINKSYAIMKVHNMTEGAERLAEDLKEHLG